MIKWEETREIIFCEQQILKNMKTIFYEKKSFLRSKDVEIRVQIFFFLNFVRFIFVNARIWRISRDLFSRICEIIFFGIHFREFGQIRKNREN